MSLLDSYIEQVYDLVRTINNNRKEVGETMSADYEVTITVKTNVPVTKDNMTGLEAIVEAMDYGLTQFLVSGEYKLVSTGVEMVVSQDQDDDGEDEDEERELEQEDDQEPQEEDEDREEDEYHQDEDIEDDEEEEEGSQQDDDGDIDHGEQQEIARRLPNSLPLPKIGGAQ